MYNVKHGSEGFVVDIFNKTCRYGAWLLSGIPYCHALAVMRDEKINPSLFVHDHYSIDKLRNVYTLTLQPINGLNMWPPPENDSIVSPKF